MIFIKIIFYYFVAKKYFHCHNMELAQSTSAILPNPQNTISIEEKHENVKKIGNSFFFSFWLLFFYAYSLLGVVAFIWSILCFDKKGSLASKIIGFFIALLLGPFYFFYYYYNRKYCKKN